jgi:hypothetical protein
VGPSGPRVAELQAPFADGDLQHLRESRDRYLAATADTASNVVPAILDGLFAASPGRIAVEDDVGGEEAKLYKPLNQAKSRPNERWDRTQEVVGSSQASSTKNRRKSAVFFVGD